MTARPHGMCHYPGHPVPGPAWPRHEPARRPATMDATGPERPRPQGGTPNSSTGLSGGPIPGPGSRTDDRMPCRVISVDPARISEETARELRDRFVAAAGRPATAYPIEPFEIQLHRPYARWRRWLDRIRGTR